MMGRKKDETTQLLTALVWHRGGTIRIAKQYLDDELPKSLALDITEEDDEVILRARTV